MLELSRKQRENTHTKTPYYEPLSKKNKNPYTNAPIGKARQQVSIFLSKFLTVGAGLTKQPLMVPKRKTCASFLKRRFVHQAISAVAETLARHPAKSLRVREAAWDGDM